MTQPALSPSGSQSLAATQAQELARACGALWLATLSLMTAYMQQQAPAHRHLLARRIARNLQTLQEQDCFSLDCRERFARIARRWEQKAHADHPNHADQPQGLLQRLLVGWR